MVCILATTYLWHLRRLAAARLADQHQRLVVLQTVQDLIAVLVDRQRLALRPNRSRVVAIEDECRHLIVGGQRVAFGGERVVICVCMSWCV